MIDRDWRMDAMAEFFNVEFVRIGEDGEPVSNEIETREELVERVAFLLDDMSLLDITETAERVIALVRADQNKQIRKELLAEAAVIDADLSEELGGRVLEAVTFTTTAIGLDERYDDE